MRLVLKLLFAVGFGATLLGGFDSWLLLHGTPEPEKVTLTELGKLDGTNNVHLSISDYVPGDKIVVESESDGRWKRVWIPLLVSGGKWTPRPVVAWSSTAKDEAALTAIFQRPLLTGVVTNGVQSLGSTQREKFAPMYPEVNLNGALAFQIDRSFPSPYVAYPLTIVGVVLLAITFALLIGLFKKPIPSTSPEDDEQESP